MKVVPILMYHSISPKASRKFRPFALSPELFGAHLAYLYENSYTPLSVSQWATALQGGTSQLPARPVVITFDDGFLDFYHAALPVLLKYGFPATLFIVTGCVEESSHWLKSEGEMNRKMLKWSHILEIDQAGIECGAHTHRHADLDIVSPNMVRKEITLSKEILEQKLGHAVATFSYPYGHYDQRVRDVVEQSAFQAACAVRNALSHIKDHRFSLARITINNRTSVQQLAALLNGKGLSLAKEGEALTTKTWREFRRFYHALNSQTTRTSL
ncbi:MAG TPA: polysaccharide deacetylase family protein [Anaerolineales bacterium]|nr:polysaccharide deacetylase family protein [Anaerolineales bacterium]